jgi:hypothetical protein
LRRECWGYISEVLWVIFEEGVLEVKFQKSVEGNISEVLRVIFGNGELEVIFENGVVR